MSDYPHLEIFPHTGSFPVPKWMFPDLDPTLIVDYTTDMMFSKRIFRLIIPTNGMEYLNFKPLFKLLGEISEIDYTDKQVIFTLSRAI